MAPESTEGKVGCGCLPTVLALVILWLAFTGQLVPLLWEAVR